MRRIKVIAETLRRVEYENGDKLLEVAFMYYRHGDYRIKHFHFAPGELRAVAARLNEIADGVEHDVG